MISNLFDAKLDVFVAAGWGEEGISAGGVNREGGRERERDCETGQRDSN